MAPGTDTLRANGGKDARAPTAHQENNCGLPISRKAAIIARGNR